MKFRRALFVGVTFAVGLFLFDAEASLREAGKIAQESPALNRSTRALGMGNTGIALEGSKDSPFYNPAGLNDLEAYGVFSVMSPTLEFTPGTFDLIGDLFTLLDDIDEAMTSEEEVQSLNKFVSNRFGEFSYGRFTLDLVSYRRKNFSAGLLIEERFTVAVRDQTLPSFDVRNTNDAILYVSGAYGFWDKLVQVGGTLKPIFRASVNERVTTGTVFDSELDDVFDTLLFPHSALEIHCRHTR